MDSLNQETDIAGSLKRCLIWQQHLRGEKGSSDWIWWHQTQNNQDQSSALQLHQGSKDFIQSWATFFRDFEIVWKVFPFEAWHVRDVGLEISAIQLRRKVNFCHLLIQSRPSQWDKNDRRPADGKVFGSFFSTPSAVLLWLVLYVAATSW